MSDKWPWNSPGGQPGSGDRQDDGTPRLDKPAGPPPVQQAGDHGVPGGYGAPGAYGYGGAPGGYGSPGPYGPPGAGYPTHQPQYGPYGSYGQYGPYGWAAPGGTEPAAIGALVAAILSWVLCPILPAIVGIVLAVQARRRIAASGGQFEGSTLATVSLWVCIINIVFWVLLIIGIVALVIAAGAGSGIFDTATV